MSQQSRASQAAGFWRDLLEAEGVSATELDAAEEAGTLELLCTKGGDGTLTLNGAALSIKGAKPLPASD